MLDLFILHYILSCRVELKLNTKGSIRYTNKYLVWKQVSICTRQTSVCRRLQSTLKIADGFTKLTQKKRFKTKVLFLFTRPRGQFVHYCESFLLQQLILCIKLNQKVPVWSCKLLSVPFLPPWHHLWKRPLVRGFVRNLNC